jgi:hypothetical protein
MRLTVPVAGCDARRTATALFGYGDPLEYRRKRARRRGSTTSTRAMWRRAATSPVDAAGESATVARGAWRRPPAPSCASNSGDARRRGVRRARARHRFVLVVRGGLSASWAPARTARLPPLPVGHGPGGWRRRGCSTAGSRRRRARSRAERQHGAGAWLRQHPTMPDAGPVQRAPPPRAPPDVRGLAKLRIARSPAAPLRRDRDGARTGTSSTSSSSTTSRRMPPADDFDRSSSAGGARPGAAPAANLGPVC